MTIVIGINSLTNTVYEAYSNHIQLFYRLGHWAAKNDHKICLVNPARMGIDRMRNLCAKTALEVNADYLLFIDDDVLVPTDFIDKLLECDADIVAGDVIIRGFPFNHMAFIGDKNGLLPIENLNREIKKQGIGQVLNVGAVGFSLCLIKVDIIRRIGQPWFITGQTNTEDIYFCLKAKEFIPELTIKLDTRVQCGHILWNEVINTSNKANYKKYYKANNTEATKTTKKSNKSGDRGVDYLKSIKEITSKVEVVK